MTTSPPLGIGIDFGGTSVKCGVVSGAEVIALADRLETDDYPDAGSLIDAMAATVESLRKAHSGIAAVGIGMPGFVDFDSGLVHNLSNVPGWAGIPLRDEFAKRCDLPCQVENDANAMAYAEWKLGAAKGCSHVVALTLGTGVGGGIISHGIFIRGAKSAAGELGQTSIHWEGRKGAYGNLGALEDYIGNNELAAEAQFAYARRRIEKTLAECQPAALAEAASAGDGIALAIWEDAARKLASGLVDCCYLLNPEIIVIGGGVSQAGNLLFAPLEEFLFSQLSGPFKDGLRIVPAHFGNEAGIIGAARLSLEEAGVV
ncbi:MAG: ROK family protein [Akkermansiaceae bacterium]|nr:ROK family protein [Akkermansiaceae bacterium]NNM29831.1 ROK family protein [Akkermansiaceae bacterium]